MYQSDHIQVIKQFEKALSRWQGERSVRPDLMRWGTRTVFEWHKYEMEQLLDEINTHRAVEDGELVSMPDLLQVEQMALGHSDYTHKLALYASELSRGIR